jgi:predicted DNA-binding protein (MmcQ/YjbR family)
MDSTGPRILPMGGSWTTGTRTEAYTNARRRRRSQLALSDTAQTDVRGVAGRAKAESAGGVATTPSQAMTVENFLAKLAMPGVALGAALGATFVIELSHHAGCCTIGVLTDRRAGLGLALLVSALRSVPERLGSPEHPSKPAWQPYFAAPRFLLRVRHSRLLSVGPILGRTHPRCKRPKVSLLRRGTGRLEIAPRFVLLIPHCDSGSPDSELVLAGAALDGMAAPPIRAKPLRRGAHTSGTIRRMDARDLRGWCLRQPGAVEDFPFGPVPSVFKVAGKMFALTALNRAPLEVSVKCEPELAVALRDSYPAIRPGYHLNKRHWNTITLDGSLPDQLVRDLIEDSYDLVVSALPKRIREQLGWAPGIDPATMVKRPSQRSA